MDLSRSIQYIFEDKKWAEKLVLMTLISFLSAIPLLGLVPLAISIGYGLQIADNVRNGLPRPLPEWDKMGDFLTRGGHILLAIVVYNLPLLTISLCLWTLGVGLGDSLFGIGISLTLLCCLTPFILFYTAISGALLAMGAMRYAQTNRPSSLYRIGFYFSLLGSHSGLVIQWLIYSFIVSIALAFIGWIPCFGQIIIVAFTIPIQSHLLGQFALELDRRIR